MAFLGFIAYQHYIYGPISEKIKEQLEIEYRQIEQLPAATLRSYSAHSRPESVLVNGSYNTEQPYYEIKKYYDTELKNKGWTFTKEEEVRNWGKDLGGKTLEYCKGKYSASIQYSGADAGYDLTYSFTMSWGFRACGAKYESKNKQLLISYGLALTCVAFIVIGSFLLFLPRNKIIKYVFRKDSEDDFKDLVVFQVNLVLFRFIGIACIIVGSFAFKALIYH